MCRLKSGIILKNDIFVPDYDGHTEMLEALKIADTRENAKKLFVRAELFPDNNDVFTDPATWNFHVDQDIRPDWFVEEYERERFIKAIRKWWDSHVFVNKDGLELPAGATYYIKGCKGATLRENSTATLRENSTATLRENSTATLRENSTATLRGNSTATLRGNSTATLRGNSTATLRENSTATLWGNSTATLRENSTATLRENSTATLWGNSTATLRENSTATLRENSTATLRENSTATLRGNSTATLRENSTGIIPDWSSNCRKNVLVLENSTLKDCNTRTIWQSGDFKIAVASDEPPKEG